MKIDFPVEKTIKARSSVRTYEKQSLSKDEKDRINACIADLSNPFSIDVAFRLMNP